MMDREKVIKGLEQCKKTACESCPYNATDAKNTNPICLIDEMLSDALELLKEQEKQIREQQIEIDRWIESYDMEH